MLYIISGIVILVSGTCSGRCITIGIAKGRRFEGTSSDSYKSVSSTKRWHLQLLVSYHKWNTSFRSFLISLTYICFSYLTSDGQRRAETSKIYKEEGKDPITVVSGFYSYFDQDGTQYIVGFTSDQNGYKSNTVRVPKGQQELRSTGMREILEELEVDLDLPEEFLEYYPEVTG